MSDAIEQKLRQDVEEYGWHVLNVFPQGSAAPGWSYSTGLFHSLSHPEIVIFGLSSDTRHSIINEVGDAVRGGQRFEEGTLSSEFLEGYDCLFKRVPVHLYETYFGRAIDFYQGKDFPVLQLVYPDRSKRWPWEEGVAEGFRLAQPVLAYEVDPGQATS